MVEIKWGQLYPCIQYCSIYLLLKTHALKLGQKQTALKPVDDSHQKTIICLQWQMDDLYWYKFVWYTSLLKFQLVLEPRLICFAKISVIKLVFTYLNFVKYYI